MEQTVKQEEISVINAKEQEEKAKWLEVLKGLLKFLRESVSNIHIGKSASIIDRMEKIQADIEEMAANNEINAEQIEKLCKVTGDIIEKAKIVNIDNIEEIVEIVQKECDLLVDLYSLKSIGKQSEIKESSIVSVIIEKFNEMGNEVPEECKKTLPEKMRIINNREVLNKDELLIEWEGAVQKITFSYENENPKIIIQDTTINKVYDENHNLLEGFSFAEKEGLSPENNLLMTFCEQNGINFYFDKEEEIRKFKETYCDERAMFFADHMDKVTLSNEGRIESQFFANDCSFHVRDKKTGDLIVFIPDGNTLEALMYHDTDDLIVDDKNFVRLGTWSTEEGKPAEANFISSITNLNISALLQCDEVRTYLNHNGLSEKFQELWHNKLFNSEKQIMSKVGKKGMEKVEELKTKVVEINASKSNDFYVTCSDANQKFTFLSISTKDGKEMSLSFDKNGVPQSLNYRENYNSKHKFVCNTETRATSRDFAKLRMDKDFSAMFSIMTEAVGGELYKEAIKTIAQVQKPRVQTNDLETLLNRQPTKYEDGVHGKVFAFMLNQKEINVSEVQREFKMSHSEAFKIVAKIEELNSIEKIEGTDKYKTTKTRGEFERLYKQSLSKSTPQTERG